MIKAVPAAALCASAIAFEISLAVAFIDDVVTVSDRALKRGVRFLLERVKLVAEPSGAITVAALLEGLVEPRGATVAVLSGGNIEWAGLRSLLEDTDA